MEDLIRRIIKEEISNRRQERLMNIIKNNGVDSAIKVVGGINNLFRILDINSPMDFLHLFDDLKIIKDTKFLWFVDKRDQQIMVYDRKLNYNYINQRKILDILTSFFGLNFKDVNNLVIEWVRNSYGLNVTKVRGQFM